MYEQWMWFWCWACYRAYMILPVASTHKSRYGRFCLWLLGYGGAYAHSTREDFHLCRFFYSDDETWRSAVKAGERR